MGQTRTPPVCPGLSWDGRICGKRCQYSQRVTRLREEVISKVAPLLDATNLPEAYIGVTMDVVPGGECESHLSTSTRQIGETIRSRMHAMANLQPELRTPLNGIIGLSELLRDEIDQAQHSMYVRLIHESSLRLSETIDRILQLSRVTSSGFQPTLTNTDVAQVVRTVARRFADRALMKGVNVAVEARERGPDVLADVEMLQQALSQVLDDAVRFAPSGSVRIALREVEDGPERFAEIAVVDTGIGVPAEFHQAVFEPFRQVSEGPHRRCGGTGLALTLAGIMVEAMKGNMNLHSEPMKGTSVRMRLPVFRD